MPSRPVLGAHAAECRGKSAAAGYRQAPPGGGRPGAHESARLQPQSSRNEPARRAEPASAAATGSDESPGTDAAEPRSDSSRVASSGSGFPEPAGARSGEPSCACANSAVSSSAGACSASGFPEPASTKPLFSSAELLGRRVGEPSFRRRLFWWRLAAPERRLFQRWRWRRLT